MEEQERNNDFANANSSVLSEQVGDRPSLQAPKKKKGKFWIILLFLLLIIAAGGCFAVYYKHNEDKELLAYEVLRNNENIADYEAFLEQFPNSEHTTEVKQRLAVLKTMYAEWYRMQNSRFASDYERFIKNYPTSLLAKQCEVKLDSLDWLEAVKENTLEAINSYVSRHPDGRYLSEASLAISNIESTRVTDSEKTYIAATIKAFYEAFGNNDEVGLNSYITPIMTRFLSKSNATKADVVSLVSRTYNEHILRCRFVLNEDYQCTKQMDEERNVTYTVHFTVDQYIQRDNEGKNFGSYTATAQLTDMFKISSLTMDEISRQEGSTPNKEKNEE